MGDPFGGCSLSSSREQYWIRGELIRRSGLATLAAPGDNDGVPDEAVEFALNRQAVRDCAQFVGQ